jgi:hypothetical protein
MPLLVVGAGATGVQVASIFNAFGARVQLFEAGPRILATEDEEVSVAAKMAFRDSGMVVRESFDWDLHVGASGEEIADAAKQFSVNFNRVLGFYYPTSEIVRDAYMQARNSREALKAWLDERVQRIIDGKQPDADRTLVYYWVKNGKLGENFRRIDIVFECFHNFLALSQ